jgi:hypothetical protein
VGSLGDVEVAVRFLDTENKRIDALAPGHTLKVDATASDYDDLYRHLVLEA